MFGIADFGNYKQLFYIKDSDTQWSIKSTELPKEAPKIAVLASVFAGFLVALEEQDLITALDNHNFYNDSILLQRYAMGLVSEIGEEAQINTEKLMQLKPNILIGSSMLNSNPSLLNRLKNTGIQMLPCDNFKEQHPLARAEWIKFFGFICNKEAKADSIFKEIENNYLTQKTRVPKKDKKPLVLTDAMYMDIWNIPGGNSYTARLIADAGAEYVFADKKDLYTYPMNLESVLKSAVNADFWIHVNQYKTADELLQADRRYAFFTAFKSKKVFNNNKRENAFGGNDFWEMGVVRPDWVLADMIEIFNSDKISYDKLYFYSLVD